MSWGTYLAVPTVKLGFLLKILRPLHAAYFPWATVGLKGRYCVTSYVSDIAHVLHGHQMTKKTVVSTTLQRVVGQFIGAWGFCGMAGQLELLATLQGEFSFTVPLNSSLAGEMQRKAQLGVTVRISNTKYLRQEYSLPLRRTRSGPAPTVRLREVSALTRCPFRGSWLYSNRM